MKITLTCSVPIEMTGQRLDQALATLQPQYSRAQWQQWIKNACVSVDGHIATKTRLKVLAEQQITVEATLTEQVQWAAQEITLNILYEDDALLVINKPAGLIVHPGAGNPDKTLVNALLHYDPNLIHVPRAGVVHRLDKDTSGILVVARNLSAHHYLIQAISQHEVKREYQAVVHGELISGGTIDAPIDRDPLHRTKMAVKNGGRDAVTHYRILEKFSHFTHIKCELETGRTHQIRVHMLYNGHPIVGDKSYCHRRGIPGKLPPHIRDYVNSFPRQALHAWRLTLMHPHNGKEVSWEAPLPDDITELLKELQHNLY